MKLSYTKDDFTDGVKPYEDLYALRDDPFAFDRAETAYAEYAKSLGVVGFKKTFAAFKNSKKKQTNKDLIGNVTVFEGQELELSSGKWECDDNGVRAEEGYGTCVACVHPIMPTLRLINIDTNNEKLKIAYKKGNRWRSIIAEKEILAGNKILSLANQGVAVNSENSKALIKYLHDIENLNYSQIPEKQSIGRCGWIHDTNLFSPYLDDIVFDGEESFKKLFKSISKKGKYSAWKETVSEVMENLQTRIVLDSAFASILVQPLGTLPFFVHLWSSVSGTGKTIALMVAASVWANPTKGHYWTTFDSTAVGQELSAGFLNSLPLVIDELQLVKDKRKFDDVIYHLSEGIGRVRGKGGGGIQTTQSWGNTIITSGEMPLTVFSSGSGAINRIIELNCDEKLFKEGNKTATALRNNYGFAGPIFLEYVQQEENMERARQLYTEFASQFEKTDVTEKQVMAASLILVADTIISELIFDGQAPLTVDQISEFLKTKTDMDINRRAYEYICQVCSMNPVRFRGVSDNKGEFWGSYDDDYYYLLRLPFRNICEEGGFNETALLGWLKKSRLIEVGKKGFDKTKRINGEPLHCIWLKKPPGYDNIEDDPLNPFREELRETTKNETKTEENTQISL